MLSDNERKIAALLDMLGADEEMGIEIAMMLHRDETSAERSCALLMAYIDSKRRYIRAEDVFAKCRQITEPREAYYPPDMWARCTAENVPMLTAGKFYQVGIVYDGDRVFAVYNDNEDTGEYPADFFELQRVTEAEYVGRLGDDGEVTFTGGFENGKAYRVLGTKNGKYQLEDGRECSFYEFLPTAFEKADGVAVQPFSDRDGALKTLRMALEFGDCGELRRRLSGESVLSYPSAGVELRGAEDITAFFRRIAADQLEKGIFIDCALAMVTGAAPTSRYPSGTRCLPIYRGGKCMAAAFCTERDGVYSRIDILTEPYQLAPDEQ